MLCMYAGPPATTLGHRDVRLLGEGAQASGSFIRSSTTRYCVHHNGSPGGASNGSKTLTRHDRQLKAHYSLVWLCQSTSQGLVPAVSIWPYCVWPALGKYWRPPVESRGDTDGAYA